MSEVGRTNGYALRKYRLRLTILASVCTGCLTSLSAATAAEIPTDPGPDPSQPPNEEKRWSSFLPLLKEDALAKGYELPLPFGVGVVYNYLARDIKVTDVRIGIDGETPRSVSKFLDLGSNSRVNAAIVRGDVWLFPFLNVYGLAGYIDNESTSMGRVTVPSLRPPGTQTFNFTVPTSLNGFVAGGGATIAAGYKSFFITGDANYSQTDIGFEDTFRALIVSLRTGWNGKVGTVPLRLWVGAAYWDTANTASSTVDVPEVGRVRFEADQGPMHPWNATVGGAITIEGRIDCFLEYGFNFDDVRIVATGLTFRF